jgi:hypothetical protein
MKMTISLFGKTIRLITYLLFFLVLVFAPHAESFTDEVLFQTDHGNNIESTIHDSPIADELFFFEEIFVFEAVFSFYESFFDVENFFGDENFSSDKETFLIEEFYIDDEIFISEFLNEESLFSEETFIDEETLVAKGSFPDENTFFFEAPVLIFEVPEYEMRSLDEIFPNFSQRQKRQAMSSTGLRRSFEKNESPSIISNPDLGIDLLGDVLKKNPSHLIEVLVVVPYNKKEFDLLDIYNVLGRISNIKDYYSTINGMDYHIFTESTRIESARNRIAVSDPLPADTLPFSETMYLRLNEVDVGNVYIRGEISISMYGITYNMTNFTDIRYFLIPIMRAERYITTIYLEPVKEGILIYSVTGFYIPGFIADRVNLTPNINRRIEVFVKWITDGLRQLEIIMVE